MCMYKNRTETKLNEVYMYLYNYLQFNMVMVIPKANRVLQKNKTISTSLYSTNINSNTKCIYTGDTCI